MKSGGKVLWLMIVLASLAVATIFLYASFQDFTSSTVVTTIATTTASLSEVPLPLKQSYFCSLSSDNFINDSGVFSLGDTVQHQSNPKITFHSKYTLIKSFSFLIQRRKIIYFIIKEFDFHFRDSI